MYPETLTRGPRESTDPTRQSNRAEAVLWPMIAHRRRGDPVRMKMTVAWRRCQLPKSHLPCTGAEDLVWLGMAATIPWILRGSSPWIARSTPKLLVRHGWRKRALKRSVLTIGRGRTNWYCGPFSVIGPSVRLPLPEQYVFYSDYYTLGLWGVTRVGLVYNTKNINFRPLLKNYDFDYK
jgi:hypothetical protein